tara:strand:- start:27362 stop:28132 length:771 start_codon:yes stop_codon:yes gene_type:complete
MTDNNHACAITEHPNFITYDDFLSAHSKQAGDFDIIDKGTLCWYYKGTMDGVLYDIGRNNGHKGMKLYWEIINTIRCITLPREIKLVGRDKVEELRTAELDILEKKISNEYKKYKDDGTGKPASLAGIQVLTPVESMEWLTGICALRCLGKDSDNKFGENIIWGISPDDMIDYGKAVKQEEAHEKTKDATEKVLGMGNHKKKKQGKNKVNIVSFNKGSTADTQDLADWIEGKTQKKPKSVIHTGGATDGSEADGEE